MFLLALAVRLLYLYESSDQPLFLDPAVDADAYNRLARALAAGHGISPDHFWQPFFYPFFLSLVYRLFGASVLAAKVTQAFIGAATCLVVYLLGARVFSRRTGLLAGVIAALYGPLVYFDGELLATGWAAFWSALLVYLLIVLVDTKRRWLCFVFGICAALAIITRPTFVPFVVAGCIWLVIVFVRAARRGRVPAVGLPLLAAGFLLVALPVAALCDRATGRFTILPYSGGVNLYVGNNPDMCATVNARPSWEWLRIETLPHEDGVREAWAKSDWFKRHVIDYARSQPLDYLAGLGRKAWRMLNSREIPRNLDMYLFRDWSAVLSVLTWKLGSFGFPCGIVLPLALVGLVLHRRRLPAAVWLYVLLYPSAVVLVFVTARYRVPVMSVLAVPAAAGALRLIELFARRSWAGAIAGVGGVLALAVVFSLPPSFCEERVDYRAELHRFTGNAAARVGDTQRAIAEYTAAVRLKPDFAEALDRLGSEYFKIGDYAKAEECYAQAVRLAPDRYQVHNNMGLVLAMTGRTEEALEQFRTAVKLKPDCRDALGHLARTLWVLGHPEEAVEHYRAVLRLATNEEAARDPLSRMAHIGLGKLLPSLGRAEEAIEHFRAALAIQPDDPQTRNDLAELLRSLNRSDEADAPE